jgi:hypothetical protein
LHPKPKNTFTHWLQSDEVSDKDRAEFMRLKDIRKEVGKEASMNIIMNKYTSRASSWCGELAVKEMTVGKRFETVDG